MKPLLSPDTQKFVDDLAKQGGPALYTLTPEQARQVLIKAQSTEIDKPDCDIQDTEFPVGPDGKLPVRIIKPKFDQMKGKQHANDEGKMPIIFYIHGGGWIMGNAMTHDRLVRKLAKGAKAAIVYPVYTNAPEGQYPVPTEQCYAALEYIAKNADKYGLDGSRIAVCGDSAGGNMATVMTIMAKEKNGPKISFQCLLYPVTNYGFDTQSYQDYAEGPWLTKKAMEWFWKAYAPDQALAKDIHVSPLQATPDQLKDLPPALVITDQNDVLRDEGEAYAQKLSEAGVKTASVRINGTHHDFMMLNGLAHTTPTKIAFLLACKKLKKALHKDCKDGCKGESKGMNMGMATGQQNMNTQENYGKGCHKEKV